MPPESGQRHASNGPSHSHRRIQAVDHGQGVLLLVEIVGLGLRYAVQCLLPSLRQGLGPGEVAGHRRLAGRGRKQIERAAVEDVELDRLVASRHRLGKAVGTGNVGLPGTSGFIGEFLTLIGVFRINSWVSLIATAGVILSACYALWLYRRIIFGALEKPGLMGMFDLSRRELVLLVPLAILAIFFGFHPGPIMDVTAASVDQLVANYNAALSAAGKLAALTP